MSRRDSDSRHHRSRSDREPSPKRIRRDSKTATDRPTSDKKHRHKLQNSVPFGSEAVPDSKIKTGSLSKDSDKKSNGYHERTKGSSKNIEAPRPRPHFQVCCSFRHQETTERGWQKESKRGRILNISSNKNDTKPKDEKTRFDGLHKMEEDSKRHSKKRPPFREEKLQVDRPDRRLSNRNEIQSGRRVEKWKHDLYDEANRTMASKK